MNPGQMHQADGSTLLFEITARDTCGPHGGHSVDRASSLLYEITRRVRSRRGLNTTYALQPIYPEEHCPQSTSRWQLKSYRLLSWPGLGPVGLVTRKVATALFLFPHLLFIPPSFRRRGPSGRG